MEIADTKAVPSNQRRRLCLFIDGTWNVEENNTNVWRMFSLCQEHSGSNQLCFYTKGVGTDYGSKIRGGILGMGFTTILRQAYEWLVTNYRKDDEIFIFGFSRGAYAARSLAGLIANCGVPSSGSPIAIEEIYDRYKHGGETRTIRDLLRIFGEGKNADFSLFERWMIKHCVTADIAMVGVWDTVGSLAGNYDYLETGLRLPIKRIYHAMALDEHRFCFRPTLLTRNIHADRLPAARSKARAIQDVEQRWFAGAHANVGGGYASDPLCQRPLRWIMTKAARIGLDFGSDIDMDGEPWTYPVKDSFREFAYHLYQLCTLGIPYKRIVGQPDRTRGKTITENVNETIDASVFERWQKNDRYRPTNLRRWADAHSLDLSTLTGSVLAKDPKTQAPAD